MICRVVVVVNGGMGEWEGPIATVKQFGNSYLPHESYLNPSEGLGDSIQVS
jgi:hypothetical protein